MLTDPTGARPGAEVTALGEAILPPLSQPAVVINVPAWKKPFLALQEHTFRRLWLAMLPGTVAMQMSTVTTGYVAYDISGSAAAIGIVALGATLPMLVFGLFGGVVADRVAKRRILVVSQSAIGIAALLYAALVLTGVVQIWHLCLVSAIEGIAFAFNMPARQAFVAQVISRERLTNAMGLHNAGSNFSRIVGPLLAGSLIALPRVGPGHAYLLVALLYAVVVGGLLRVPHDGAPVGTTRQSPLRALGDGLTYLRSNPVVSTLLLLAVAPMLLGMPYQQLMPVFAKDVFDVGPRGLGLLLTVNGIGALIGALTIASITTFRRRGLLQMSLGITFGLTVALFAFGQSFGLALVVLLFVGFSWACFQALNSAMIVSNTEPGYTGRVMSVYLLTFSVMDIGAVIFGAFSDRFGAPVSVGVGGLLLAGVIAGVGVLHPSYRQIR
jgi:MFS family permease